MHCGPITMHCSSWVKIQCIVKNTNYNMESFISTLYFFCIVLLQCIDFSLQFIDNVLRIRYSVLKIEKAHKRILAKVRKLKFFSLFSTCLPALFTDINALWNHYNALYFTKVMKNYRAKFLFCWHRMHCSRGSVHWGLCNMHTFLYAFNWDKWRNDINEISKIIYKLNPL